MAKASKTAPATDAAALAVGQPVQYHPNGFEHITGRECYPAVVSGTANEDGNYEVIVSHQYGSTVQQICRIAGTAVKKDTPYITPIG